MLNTRAVSSVGFALALPVLLAGSTGCDIATAQFRESATEQWQRNYDLQPGGRVEIRNVNGRIRVRSSEGNRVEVSAEKIAKGSSDSGAREALAQIELVETVAPDSVRIETRVPRLGGLFGSSAEVRYEVRVPRHSVVHFTTVNGGIELDGIEGRIDADTTNGGITGRQLAGSISASTTNGGVDLEMTTLADGGATLKCVNGGLKLRLPADAKATISASITNGGIDTNGLPLETSESSRRRLEGRLNGGGAPVRLSGTNGGISVRAR